MVNGNVHTIYHHPGGSVQATAAVIEEYRRAQIKVKIDGTLVSSGTLFLTLAEVCITSRAIFRFHGPAKYNSGTNQFVPFETVRGRQWAKALFIEKYAERPALQAWFEINAVHLFGSETVDLTAHALREIEPTILLC
jgi:hypothetical protein